MPKFLEVTNKAAARSAINAAGGPTPTLWQQPALDPATGVGLAISSQANNFSGTLDPIAYFGINMNSGAQINTAHPGVAWALEQNYNDGTGENKMEAYCQFHWAPNQFSRPFFASFNRATNLIRTAIMSAETINFTTSDVSVPMGYMTRGNFVLQPGTETTSVTLQTTSGHGSLVTMQYGGANSGYIAAEGAGYLSLRGTSSIGVAGDTVTFLKSDGATSTATLTRGTLAVSAAASGNLTKITVGSAASQISQVELTYNGSAMASFQSASAAIASVNVAGQECAVFYGSVGGSPGTAVSVGVVDNTAAVVAKASQTGQVGVIARGKTSQVASIFEAQKSDSTVLVSVPAAGGLVVGSSVLSTSATDGFMYVPTCAGTPTGTPTARTGTVPIVFDTNNNKLMVYSVGAWRGVTVS